VTCPPKTDPNVKLKLGIDWRQRDGYQEALFPEQIDRPKFLRGGTDGLLELKIAASMGAPFVKPI
jgi:hypothetical protein